ncbi:hypothetical protein [Pseudomonas cerasi]
MFIASLCMFFRYWRHTLFGGQDVIWMKNSHKIVQNEEVGDTGRYNFGQKYLFWAAIASLILLLASGIVIWRPYFTPAFSILPIRAATGGAICRGGEADYGDYSACLCRAVGARRDNRDGRRPGHRHLSQKRPFALVS